jgi:hypothetical protein
MLLAIFADGDHELELVVPQDSAWPPVPPPSATDPFYVSNLSPINAPLPSGFRQQHTRSLAEELEEEMPNRYSMQSNCTVSSLLAEQLRDLESDDTLKKDAKQSSSVELSDGQSTPRFEHLRTGEILCTRTFGVAEGTRTPSPEGSSTPKSPNALNKSNEQDPAFILTLNAIKTQTQTEANEQDPVFIRSLRALRSNSQGDASLVASENRPLTFAATSTTTTIESAAQRCGTSVSARANESNGSTGSKRRYFSFVNRLRGRASIRLQWESVNRRNYRYNTADIGRNQ